MNLPERLLRYFVAVAEMKSFSAPAGTKLHTSQPVISAGIKRLEDKVGIQLFERTSRLVELTPSGKAFLSYAYEILDAYDRTRRATEKLRSGEGTTLHLGIAPYLEGLGPIESLIDNFQTRYPAIAIETYGGYLPSLTLDLNRHRTEVIFSTEIDQENLVGILLGRFHVELMIPEENPLAKYENIELEQLSGQNILIIQKDLSPAYYKTATQPLLASGVNATVARHNVYHWYIRQARRERMIVPVIKELMSRTDLIQNDMVLRPLADRCAYLNYFLYRLSDERSVSMQLFWDAAERHLRLR